MSMEQFSKGPFGILIEYADGVANCFVKDVKCTTIAEISSSWCDSTEEANLQAEANTRLLAASWEILRLLKEAHDYGDISCISEDWHTRADALIARVEGREVRG